MKTIYKTGIITGFALVLNISVGKAQEFDTEVSIRKQLINNNVPGLKYAPDKRTITTRQKQDDKPKTYNKGDFKSTLDESGPHKSGGVIRQTNKRTANAAARTAQKPLISERPAEKKEQPKIEPPKLPDQGE